MDNPHYLDYSNDYLMKGNSMKDNHIDKTKIHVCVICSETIKPKLLGLDNDGNKHYWYDGNNAEPVANGKCCDNCNSTVVIPQRFTDLQMSIIERKMT